MTSTAEPILYAISVEPRSARCGETVRIVFRTRNYGTRPSPPGIVAFALGPGLEPLDALDVGVDAVESGDDVVASIRARIGGPLPDRTEIPVSATIDAGGVRYHTNVDTLVVRSTAVLDGEASGTFIESSGDDQLCVRAVVTNEGDGPAQDVRITLRPPLGSERTDGDGSAHVEIPRLDPGERAEATLEARIVTPVAELRADDATVSYDRGCVSIAARGIVRFAPILRLTAVVDASRRSARILIEVENRGWSAAHDAQLAITLPPQLRVVEDSLALDGVPFAARRARRATRNALARAVRDRGGINVTIATVPARDAVRVALVATFSGECPDGSVGVSLGPDRVEALFAPERVRDLRAYPLGGARHVVAGDVVRLAARVVNAGDVDERVTFAVAGQAQAVREVLPATVRAGTAMVVELAVQVAGDAPDGARIAPVLIVADRDAERTRASFSLCVRAALSSTPALDDPASTPAAQRCDGGIVEGALHSAQRALTGVPFTLHCSFRLGAAAHLVTIRTAGMRGAMYLPGSTVLDGHAVLDPIGTAPLGAACPLEGDGLVLRDVPPGTRISASWTIVPDRSLDGEPLAPQATVECDGVRTTLICDAVMVGERGAFALRPGGLPYYVEASTVAPAEDRDAPVVPADGPVDDGPPRWTVAGISECAEIGAEFSPLEFSLRVDRARMDRVVRLLDALRSDGLTAHLFVLRLFFPEIVSSADPALRRELEALGTALRDVFDRLYVKLRIPGFTVSSDDLEDAELRRSLVACFERLGDSRLGRGTCESLRHAPYGAPIVLRALVSLLPVRCDDDVFAAALSRYAALLDGVLARYEGVPLELFDDALARGKDAALDDAREELLRALQPYLIALETVC